MTGVHDDDGNPVMPFGKHKGVLLSEVLTDYLWWALDESETLNRYPGLAEAIESELEERAEGEMDRYKEGTAY